MLKDEGRGIRIKIVFKLAEVKLKNPMHLEDIFPATGTLRIGSRRSSVPFFYVRNTVEHCETRSLSAVSCF